MWTEAHAAINTESEPESGDSHPPGQNTAPSRQTPAPKSRTVPEVAAIMTVEGASSDIFKRLRTLLNSETFCNSAVGVGMREDESGSRCRFRFLRVAWRPLPSFMQRSKPTSARVVSCNQVRLFQAAATNIWFQKIIDRLQPTLHIKNGCVSFFRIPVSRRQY